MTTSEKLPNGKFKRSTESFPNRSLLRLARISYNIAEESGSIQPGTPLWAIAICGAWLGLLANHLST